MKKSFLLLMSALTLSCCAVGITACNGEETPITGGTTNISLNQTALLLDRYESKKLIVTVEGENAGEIIWTSSNESVASVMDGTVIPNGEGTAILTATYGEQSATCTVSVEDSGIVPVLSLDYETVALLKDDAYSIGANVIYKNEQTSDATVSYTVSNPEIVTISNDGVITPVGLGETQVSIQASWRNYTELYGVVTIKIIPNIEVRMYGYENEIFTYSGTIEGRTFADSTTCVAEVYSEDRLVENPDITWHASNDEVLTVDAQGKVSAQNRGIAQVWYTYSENGQEYASEKADIAVSLAVIDKTLGEDARTHYFSLSEAVDGKCTLNSAEIFGSGKGAIVEVYNEDEPSVNLYEGGKVTVEEGGGMQTYVMVNEHNFGYKMNVILVTDVITTTEEFFAMNNDLAGYYVLGNDLDFSAQVINSKTDGTGWNSISWVSGSGGTLANYSRFTGTFDGNGYALKNVKVNGYNNTQGINACLFGFTQGATIKNVMADITLGAVNKNSVKCAGFIGRADSTVIDNCMITLHTDQAGYGSNYIAPLASQIAFGTTVTNCIAILDTSAGIISDNKNTFGALVGIGGGDACSVDNCYAIYVGANGDSWTPTVRAGSGSINVSDSTAVYKGYTAFTSGVNELSADDGWNTNWKLVGGSLYFGTAKIV